MVMAEYFPTTRSFDLKAKGGCWSELKYWIVTMSVVSWVAGGMSRVATTTGMFFGPPPPPIEPPLVFPSISANPKAPRAQRTPKSMRSRLLFGFTSVAINSPPEYWAPPHPAARTPVACCIHKSQSFLAGKRRGLPTGSPLVCSYEPRRLLAQAARDVAEDVLDLVTEDDKDHDNDHSDQDEDKGVLYHALPFLSVEQLAQTKIKAGQHCAIHLLTRDRVAASVSHRSTPVATEAPHRNRTGVVTTW